MDKIASLKGRLLRTRSERAMWWHDLVETWRKPSFVIDATIAWNHVLVAISVMAAVSISKMRNFYDLGDAVQGFVSLLTLVPAVLAVLSSILINRRRAVGRALALAVNYVGMVLCIFYLLHLWGVFLQIDDLAQGLYEDRNWLLGFAAAYAMYRIAGWMPDNKWYKTVVDQIAMGLAMVTTVALLLALKDFKPVQNSFKDAFDYYRSTTPLFVLIFILALIIAWPFGLYKRLGETIWRRIVVIFALFVTICLLIPILSQYDQVRVWLVTIVMVVFAVLAYRMLHLGDYFGETPDQRIAWQGWLMLSPNAIGFMIFFAGPLLLSFYLSFTKSEPGSPPDYIGLQNYQRIFSVQVKTQTDTRDLNTYIALLDAENNPLAANDDGPEPASSRIDSFTLPETGVYTIRATGGGSGRKTGPYTLLLKSDAEVAAPPEGVNVTIRYGDSVNGRVRDSSGENWQFYGQQGDVVSILMRGNVYAEDVLSTGYDKLTSFNMGDTRVVVGAMEVLFWRSLRNTILFCLLLIPLSIIPALGLAVLLNSKIPGMHFFRAVYFLPSVAAVVGTAMIWRQLYDSNGYINFALGDLVGFINNVLGTSMKEPETRWLTNPSTILISIVFLAAWQAIGFNTVLFLAGLQGVPRILYEAAYVDGANRWKQFRHVTLPMLAPTTFFVVVTTIITGLQVFNEPYALLSEQDPIPTEGTTSVYYLYRSAFKSWRFGFSSAVAWTLFALIFVVTLIQFRLSRSEAYES